MIKKLLKKLLYPALDYVLPSGYLEEKLRTKLHHVNLSYAQEGEDLVLQRYFGNRPRGFYVDIGAHHPTYFSNTHIFYLRGWRGINIDANPGSMAPFLQLRSEDTNLEMGITATPGELEYFIFDEPALNTFSRKRAEELVQNTHYRLVKSVSIKTDTLPAVLDRYLPKGTAIDFMTVDVEGLDFDILQTNDWDRYRPEVLLVEDFVHTRTTAGDTPLHRYLVEKGYAFFAKTGNTLFYRDERKG